jgi:hypothetical protein
VQGRGDGQGHQGVLVVGTEAEWPDGEPLHVTHEAALTFDWLAFIGRCLER